MDLHGLPHPRVGQFGKQGKDTYVTNTTFIDPATKPKDTVLPLSNISFIDMSRFSSFTKLLRVTAYVLRFLFQCRGGSHLKRLDLLTTDELELGRCTYAAAKCPNIKQK
jgi:hypothetical protein